MGVSIFNKESVRGEGGGGGERTFASLSYSSLSYAVAVDSRDSLTGACGGKVEEERSADWSAPTGECLSAVGGDFPTPTGVTFSHSEYTGGGAERDETHHHLPVSSRPQQQTLFSSFGIPQSSSSSSAGGGGVGSDAVAAPLTGEECSAAPPHPYLLLRYPGPRDEDSDKVVCASFMDTLWECSSHCHKSESLPSSSSSSSTTTTTTTTSFVGSKHQYTPPFLLSCTLPALRHARATQVTAFLHTLTPATFSGARGYAVAAGHAPATRSSQGFAGIAAGLDRLSGVRAIRDAEERVERDWIKRCQGGGGLGGGVGSSSRGGGRASRRRPLVEDCAPPPKKYFQELALLHWEDIL